MKKTFLIIAMALLGMTQAVAQEYEYVPFVREGVKWVCYYDNPINPTIDFDGTYIPYGTHYYTLELKGDTVINDRSYKPLHLYSGTSINEEIDTVPVYLREENKIVYAIIPDNTKYYECPIGIGVWVNFTDFLPVGSIKIGTEFKLYDFNDLVSFYDNHSIEAPYSEWLGLRNESSIGTDTVLIGDHMRKRLVIHTPYWDEHVIEGIGFAHTRMPGTPFNYFYIITSGVSQVIYNLCHVMEDGEIVHRGAWCQHVITGIDEAVTDKTSRPIDPHYYDLMGRAVGTEVPTEPGIYIHQGKKIVIR